MSSSQKTLKIISIVLLVWAVLVIIFGALMAAGSQVPGMSNEVVDIEGTTVDLSLAAMGLAIGTIVNGVINLVIALFGLRGAKNPAKIGVFFILCIIGLVLGAVGLVMDISQGVFQWTSLVSFALIIVCTVLAYNIKKQA